MMKKLTTIAMTCVCLAISASEWTPAQLNEATAKLEQKDLTVYQRKELEKNIAVLGGETPASFDEIIARTSPIERKYNPAITDESIIIQSLSYACWHYNAKFVQEGYDNALQFKCSIYIYRFINSWQEKLGVTDIQAYQKLMKCLKDTSKKCLLPGDYIPCLEAAMKKADAIDDQTILADLKKLNRIYTAKLIQDKAKWESLVIAIRTYMDTYR